MRKSPFLAAALLLSACAGSPDPHYYTLATVAPKQAPAPGPVYHLATVKLPDLLDRTQMVVRTGPQTIDIDEYDRWAEPLERMTARVLAQDIAQRRPRGPLTVSVDQAKLQVTIDEFATDRSSGDAHLSGSWKVTETDGSLRGGPFSYSQPVSGSDPTAIAAAMSALLGQLADEIGRN